MRARFEERARLEFGDARAWYAAIRVELGREFAAEVRAAAKRIGQTPLLYPIEVDEIRKCVLSRFPYTLRYALREGVPVILAVSHQHRSPDYWVDRISDT